MKYQLIELTDRYSRDHKDGSLWYVGNPSRELRKELGIILCVNDYCTFYYRTSLEKLSNSGWELLSVTPCWEGHLKHEGGLMRISNTYVFRKRNDKEFDEQIESIIRKNYEVLKRLSDK